MTALLCACTTPAPTPDPEPEKGADSSREAASGSDQQGPAPENAARIRRLLAAAGRALAEDHLSYPARGSAVSLYDRVRAIDPDNAEAARGLEQVVERYLELALRAAERRRFENARTMLDRARQVDPAHPGIRPTAAQVDLLKSARRRVFELNPGALDQRSTGIVETLDRAGAASREKDCRARIVARSDPEGRWIYRRMSDAPGDRRIRAQLDVGSPPRVEVICFADSP
ncbi:MAG: hypothetical protein ACODAC_11225 [Pseudomonadota bacterium]